MRILFWNTHKNHNINPYVISLVIDYNIDIVVLAEYEADVAQMSELFDNNISGFSKCYTNGCDRIHIWSNYMDIESGIQDDYYSIQVIQDNFIMCAVHLISDTYGDRSEERLVWSQKILHEIERTEEELHSKKTIIIGDFNEMPYDRVCLNANGFHGLPVLSTTDAEMRAVTKIQYRKFYNPMWNLMGDFSYPPGTYYLNQAKLHSPMWYMLDQVIISKAMLPFFKRECLKIITTCGHGDLMDSRGHPDKNISDHFPIICEINDK